MVSKKVLFLFFLFLLKPVLALNNCDPQVSLINQDPYPAVPGEYVTLLFQVGGLDNSECKEISFKINPSFPFSLEGENERKIFGSIWDPNYKKNWLIPFKLRVSSDAISSEYEIEVNYSFLKNITLTKKFNVSVKDLRTKFDAVIQEINGNNVVIAIANTGKHNANSVIVRVPDQPLFKPIIIDGQMIGNLQTGDYSVVSFNFFSLSDSLGNKKMQNEKVKLLLDVYYTDELGERRVEKLEIPIKPNINNSLSFNTNFQKRVFSSSNKFSFKNYVLILFFLVILLIILFKINPYKLFRKKKSLLL
ncbi:MAG: hypothetical protein QW273_00020 [Candidatus Pacearchaeota archaeon]